MHKPLQQSFPKAHLRPQALQLFRSPRTFRQCFLQHCRYPAPLLTDTPGQMLVGPGVQLAPFLIFLITTSFPGIRSPMYKCKGLSCTYSSTSPKVGKRSNAIMSMDRIAAILSRERLEAISLFLLLLPLFLSTLRIPAK